MTTSPSTCILPAAATMTFPSKAQTLKTSSPHFFLRLKSGIATSVALSSSRGRCLPLPASKVSSIDLDRTARAGGPPHSSSALLTSFLCCALLICDPVICNCFCADLNDSTSSADSFLGHAAAAVLVYRPAVENAVNGILVSMLNSQSAHKWFVFSVAHGSVSRKPNKPEIQHRNIRLLLLQPDAESLSLTAPETFIELPWTRCIHSARAHYAASGGPERFTSDCSVFELPADALSDSIRSRAVPLFDWQGGAHKPSSKAVGVSLVRDEADRASEKYMEIRIEERVSAWSDMYVYLPSEVSAKGQSGTGLTDKKGRLVSVISGNYEIGTKRIAVAVLAKRHVQLLLLHQQSESETFERASDASLSDVTGAVSSSGASKRGKEGQENEQQVHGKEMKR